jgi:hypothetical protein
MAISKARTSEVLVSRPNQLTRPFEAAQCAVNLFRNRRLRRDAGGRWHTSSNSCRRGHRCVLGSALRGLKERDLRPETRLFRSRLTAYSQQLCCRTCRVASGLARLALVGVSGFVVIVRHAEGLSIECLEAQ